MTQPPRSLFLLAFALGLGATAALAQTPPPPKNPPGKSRVELKSKAVNMAAGVAAAEAALTPEQLEIAQRVYVDRLPCELGASVTLEADAKAPGYFNLSTGKFKFRMFPMATTTGAIRLEDHVQGAVWLQLANKSMLMSQKLGTRLADECLSPAQAAVAEAIKLNPPLSPLDSRPGGTNSTPTVFPSPAR